MHKPYICPVCGCDGLAEPAYNNDGRGSFDICSCCGYQYEVDNADKGIDHEEWRVRWINNGCRFVHEQSMPENWSAEAQLLNINIRLDKFS